MLNNFKKYTLCCLIVLSIMYVKAQKQQFLRVYNLEGKKIMKCNKYTLTDTSFVCIKSGKTIPYHAIGSIKTGRSFGHSLWLGATIGISASTVISSIITQPSNFFLYSSNVGNSLLASALFVGLPIGIPAGSLVAAGIHPIKKKRYGIDGNLDQWNIFRQKQSGQMIIKSRD